MKKAKKIIYIVILILIVAFVVIVSLVLNYKKDSNSNDITNNNINTTENITNTQENTNAYINTDLENTSVITEEEESDAYYSDILEPVNNATYFYTVQSCLENYLSENESDDEEFIGIDEMRQQNIENSTIMGFTLNAVFFKDLALENKKYVVYLDYDNLTYLVEETNSENIIDIELNKDVKIEKNEKNTYSYEVVTDKKKINNYLEFFGKLCINAPEIAYEKYLSEDYKNTYFKTVNEFKKYVVENEEDIEYLALQEISSYVDDSDKYKCTDNMGQEYVIIETNIMNFKIDVYSRL